MLVIFQPGVQDATVIRGERSKREPTCLMQLASCKFENSGLCSLFSEEHVTCVFQGLCMSLQVVGELVFLSSWFVSPQDKSSVSLTLASEA